MGDQILFLLYYYKVIEKTVHRFLICLFANKKFDFSHNDQVLINDQLKLMIGTPLLHVSFHCSLHASFSEQGE